MLTADDFACAFQEWVDPAWADIAIANPATASMARCHASISYIRGHQAWNIDLFWNSASHAIRDHASETVRKWRTEAIKI